MVLKVFVHGGCVSRDFFEFQKDKFFEIAYYSARSSIATLSFPKLSKEIDLSELSSKFQKRIINDDHQRKLLQHLNLVDFDILLLDFNVERYDLINVNNLGFLTNSSDFSKVSMGGERQVVDKIGSYTNLHFTKFMEGFDLIYNVMKNRGLETKIFINKLFWAYKYKSGDDFSYSSLKIDKINNKLNKIYRAIADKYPKVNFIEYERTLFLANIDHKWGPAPYHYVDDLYLNTIKNLKVILFNQLLFVVNKFEFNGRSVVARLSEVSSSFKLQYAAYLIKDGVVVQKKWYQDNSLFKFSNINEGVYQVKFFIRIQNTDIKKTLNTKSIKVT